MEPDELLQNMQAKIYFKRGRTPEGLSFDDNPRQKNMRLSFSLAPVSRVSLNSGFDNGKMFYTLEITDPERNQGQPFSFQYAESSNETRIAHPISCTTDRTLILNMKKATHGAVSPIPVKLKLHEDTGFTELPDEVELYLCFQGSDEGEGHSKRAVFRRFHDPEHQEREARDLRMGADEKARREEDERQFHRIETEISCKENWTEYFSRDQDGPSPRTLKQLHDNAYTTDEWNTMNNRFEKDLAPHKPYSQGYFTKDTPGNTSPNGDDLPGARPAQDGSGHHTKKYPRKRRTKKRRTKKKSKKRRTKKKYKKSSKRRH